MPSGYDFAIFGSGPFSALLAGLLAHDHGKQVARIAPAASPQRLSRGLDIALPFATRPESWRLLRRSEAETAALLASIEAGDVLGRAEVEIVADLDQTAAALAHMAHVAAGYGHRPRNGRFANVAMLTGEISLVDSKVQSLEPHRVRLGYSRSGVAELTFDDELMPVAAIVLADDPAILEHLPEAQRPAQLIAQPMTATLTAPARRLPAPVRRFPDRGVTLLQRADRSVLGLVAGASDVDARLASCLAGPFPLPRRATAHYQRLLSRDGAPLIGRLEPSGLTIVAGLGDAAAFLAPAVARALAGKSTDEETGWFVAHNPSYADRELIADFAEAPP